MVMCAVLCCAGPDQSTSIIPWVPPMFSISDFCVAMTETLDEDSVQGGEIHCGSWFWMVHSTVFWINTLGQDITTARMRGGNCSSSQQDGLAGESTCYQATQATCLSVIPWAHRSEDGNEFPTIPNCPLIATLALWHANTDIINM